MNKSQIVDPMSQVFPKFYPSVISSHMLKQGIIRARTVYMQSPLIRMYAFYCTSLCVSEIQYSGIMNAPSCVDESQPKEGET